MIKSFGQISSDEQDGFKNKLGSCFGDLETRVQRNETSKAATIELPTKQQGRISKLFGEHSIKQRTYRIFTKEERLPQLLKQIATQLYFYGATKNAQLVELQIMYCEFGNKSKLFIAANKLQDATIFFESLISQKIEELITSIYAARDPEGKIRSKRYSKKLKKLFAHLEERFDTSKEWDWVLNAVKNVIDILQKIPQLLPLTYTKDKGDIDLNENSKESIQKAIECEHQLYLITGQCNPHPCRHAEEFLCDIFKYIKDSNPPDLFSCIGGKMRPCVGCSGRMESIYFGNFNKNPGKLWLNTIEHQPSSVATESLKILFNQPSYISLSKERKESPSYDSGSESDFSDEDSAKNSSIHSTKNFVSQKK
ncbi:hypothetical protein CYY_010265 [Polysphondylium violaceum]|uniref:Uncharacterized protein n=1 Tax=Polysphondylium violaceum TaxID=133409 RepID=A0A8J4PJT8_9MYCE|nr:hypothetical protein CYY_010265 [Polysphondylium violaceum]